MYDKYSISVQQKVTFTVLHFFIILFSFWLMFMNGIDIIAGLFGFPVQVGDNSRRNIILFAMGAYFAKNIISQFVFMKRELKWSEALTIALWLFIAYSTFSFTGASNTLSAGKTETAGIIVFAVGILINFISELQRFIWKRKQENKNKLYHGGLFRLSRHINYLGDVIMFTGFAMLTRNVWVYIIPLTLILAYTFINIPMLDAHLMEKYGDEYEEYSHHSKKFIPFLY
ncbi:MAG: DUF1295 domain-containing protein [Ignavibacteriae bacterium]|nr:MAG: DUF1295 domain-containing protein [Ignavibacteriota bacterium]